MITIIKIYKDNCPLCKSVGYRLSKMEKTYSNLVVLGYDWERLPEESKEYYVKMGVERTPFLVVMDLELLDCVTQKTQLITEGFTPVRLVEQLEDISGEKLVIRV